MTILVIVLSVALFIALLYIAVERFITWLTRQGGITIRIEPIDDEDE